MSSEVSQSNSKIDLEKVVSIYFKFVAAMILFYGVRYWMMILGIWDDTYRFDIMLNHWRVLTATLAVLMPVASLGLWGFFQWGIAIWIMIVIIECTAYFFMADLFGSQLSLVSFHISSVFLLLIYKLAKVLDKSRYLDQDT